MDSGDDPTYMLSPAEHPDEPSGTIHDEAGEMWHKPLESGGTKQTGMWMPVVSVAELRPASWENSRYSLLEGLAGR